MNKKLESLKKLREVVSQQKELAGRKYIDCNENHCAIGHLFKLGGVSNEQLNQLETGMYSQTSEIEAILEAAKTIDLPNNFVKNGLETLGFDLTNDKGMLMCIQEINDFDESDIEAIKERIDMFIDELQKERV